MCDQIPEDDQSGLTHVKIGLDGTWTKKEKIQIPIWLLLK